MHTHKYPKNVLEIVYMKDRRKSNRNILTSTTAAVPLFCPLIYVPTTYFIYSAK